VQIGIVRNYPNVDVGDASRLAIPILYGIGTLRAGETLHFFNKVRVSVFTSVMICPLLLVYLRSLK